MIFFSISKAKLKNASIFNKCIYFVYQGMTNCMNLFNLSLIFEMIIHLDKFDHFTLNQNNSKSHVNEQNVLCFLHFNILADVWSEWAGWSSCSVECRGICNRNRNRTCLNETCSGDQAVSMGMLFRINNTEIEEEECNYNNTACKGNFRNKREVPFRLIKIKKALSPFYHKSYF